jgi:glycosyltransferase involved in cell wall biosynthesis
VLVCRQIAGCLWDETLSPLDTIDAILLSVVMPAYNERATIAEIVRRVMSVPIRKELIIVDDGSTDGTREILQELAGQYDAGCLRIILQAKNRGKGAALRLGIKHARGDYIVVQDADLEYNPSDYFRLLAPCIDHHADVVYGSRFVTSGQRRVLLYWHSVGNRMLTMLSNVFTDLTLTDMETCYKLFRREVIQSIRLEQNRFGFEPEITAKIAHRGLCIFEVGISYAGRSYEDGKKIGWRDGINALYCIVRYGMQQRGLARSARWGAGGRTQLSTAAPCHLEALPRMSEGPICAATARGEP